MSLIITARKRSLGQGNIFRSMCQEFCSQGGSASVHAGIPIPPGPGRHPHPWTRQPPPRTRQAPPAPGREPPTGTRHPPRTRHIPEQSMLADTANERAVCILLECNLVGRSNHQQTCHPCFDTRISPQSVLLLKF